MQLYKGRYSTHPRKGKCRMHHQSLILDSTSEQAFQTAMKVALVAKRWVDWLVHLCQYVAVPFCLDSSWISLVHSRIALISCIILRNIATWRNVLWSPLLWMELTALVRECGGAFCTTLQALPFRSFLVVLMLNTCEHVKGLREIAK